MPADRYVRAPRFRSHHPLRDTNLRKDDPRGSPETRAGSRLSFNLVLMLGLVGVGTGCEKGCLSAWLGDRGVGGMAPEGTGRKTPSTPLPSMDLSGTDCSDGLLRCSGGGRIEASRAAHLPASCASAQSKEKPIGCTCPWDEIGRCTTGCVVEDEEVIATSIDAGATQVCRPDAPVARPILATDEGAGEICATADGYACVNDIVRVCDHVGAPVRRLGKCLFGCQLGVSLPADDEPLGGHGESKNPDGPLSILCRRNHAERR